VWPVVLAVQLGVLLAALEATIVGTAMPTLVAALGEVALYPWIFSAYMLASTVVMPVFGALSDRVGRQRPFLAAVGVFCAGSAVAGAAPGMAVVVAGRVLQGIGAGGLISLSIIIFGDLFPAARRGRMQGLITAVWGFASIAGPLLGGFIVDHWGWRWVFYVNLPVGVVVAGLIAGGLRETAVRHAGRALDLPGAATFLLGVVALLFALLAPGGGSRRALSPERLLAGAVAVAALAAFLRVERRSPDPLLPPGLLRDRTFAAGAAAAFCSGAAMFGALVHLPLLVQWGLGRDATTAGLSLMTMSTGWSLGGLAAGQLVNRLGFWPLAVGGMAVMAAGYGLLAARPDAGLGPLMWAGGVVGVGMGLASVTLILVAQTLIRPDRRGVATSGFLFFRNVGATVGVALMGAVLTARLGAPAAAAPDPAGGLPALGPGLAAEVGLVLWLGAGAALLGLAATTLLPRGSPLVAARAAGDREPRTPEEVTR
jgi:EmrB/QacA subfamily drug resistance transporter